MKPLVLIADDNPQNLRLLEAILDGGGYQVAAAANGAEALAQARKQPPCLVVSDILMPTMDGFALCREWQKDERLRSIPFVFCTATYTDERDRDFALGLGARCFLVKPEEPDALLRTIQTLVEKAQRPSPVPTRAPAEAPPEEDVGYLRQYNQALIRRLELKMQQEEKINRALEQDLAEQKQAEQALRESEENYRTLFQEMLDGFALHEIICDAQGKPVNYRFLSVNPAFERLTGLKASAIVGKTVLDILPHIEPHWIETYGQVALTGRPATFENYSGELQKHFMVTAFRPAPNQFACIFVDLTERTLAEERLKNQMKELQRWHEVTLGRETRVVELKREVNALLTKAGQPPRYDSVE